MWIDQLCNPWNFIASVYRFTAQYNAMVPYTYFNDTQTTFQWVPCTMVNICGRIMVEINSNILLLWLVNIDDSAGSSTADDNGPSIDLTSISLFSGRQYKGSLQY